jgi:Secretion system C-terminal sorting domain
MLPEITTPESFYVMNGELVDESAVKEWIKINETAEPISIFPNPVLNQITVAGIEVGDRIVISDLLGRNIVSILCAFEPPTQVDLSKLEAGIYCVRILRQNLVVYSSKLIKVSTE